MTLKSNAEEPALIAQGVAAEVIGGPVRYPSEMGDIAVAAVDIGEYLCELKDQEVLPVMAPLGPVEKQPVICGLFAHFQGCLASQETHPLPGGVPLSDDRVRRREER